MTQNEVGIICSTYFMPNKKEKGELQGNRHRFTNNYMAKF